jgi:hypothetical protein
MYLPHHQLASGHGSLCIFYAEKIDAGQQDVFKNKLGNGANGGGS